jgi:hypothetical protein
MSIREATVNAVDGQNGNQEDKENGLSMPSGGGAVEVSMCHIRCW